MMGTVIEVRPGEGGDDAVVFAEELVGAICGFARRNCVSVTVRTGRTYRVEGVFPERLVGLVDQLSGVHRVQRIPKNAKNGRRHTSTVSVAVMDVDTDQPFDVDPADVRMEVFRGSGPGGQHRNTSDSCVRLIHEPSGTVVVATESRSQHDNRRMAWRRLQERLRAAAAADRHLSSNRARRDQIDSGERPVKRWTWNQQRNQVTDHLTGRTVPMSAMLSGQFPSNNGA